MDRLSVHVSDLDLVESGFSQDWDRPTVQRDGDRFPGTRQA